MPQVSAGASSDSGGDAVDAVVEPVLAEAAAGPGLPQPGLILAVVLTSVPLIVQVVLGAVLSILILLAMVVVTARPHEINRYAANLQIYMLPAGTLITLLVALAVCRLFYGRSMGRKLGWRRLAGGQLACVLLLTVPLGILASEVTNCVGVLLENLEIPLLEAFRQTGSEVFGQFVLLPGWLVFVGGCLLPGLGEEIYCRGLLSRGLVARYGVIGGTLFAAGLFGAMHIEPVQATGAFALGLGLQFVYLSTKSLLAPIVMHTLNNSLAFVTMRYAEAFPIQGLTPLPDGQVAHTPPLLWGSALLSGGLLLAVMYQNRTTWRRADGSPWSPGYVTAETPAAELAAVPVRQSASPALIIAAGVAFGVLIAAIVAAHRAVAG